MQISLSNINTPRLSRQSLPWPRRISIPIYESLSVVNKQGAGENDLRSLPSGCLDRIIRLALTLFALAALHQQPPSLSVDLLFKVFVCPRAIVGFELGEIGRKWTRNQFTNYWKTQMTGKTN